MKLRWKLIGPTRFRLSVEVGIVECFSAWYKDAESAKASRPTTSDWFCMKALEGPLSEALDLAMTYESLCDHDGWINTDDLPTLDETRRIAVAGFVQESGLLLWRRPFVDLRMNGVRWSVLLTELLEPPRDFATLDEAIAYLNRRMVLADEPGAAEATKATTTPAVEDASGSRPNVEPVSAPSFAVRSTGGTDPAFFMDMTGADGRQVNGPRRDSEREAAADALRAAELWGDGYDKPTPIGWERQHAQAYPIPNRTERRAAVNAASAWLAVRYAEATVPVPTFQVRSTSRGDLRGENMHYISMIGVDSRQIDGPVRASRDQAAKDAPKAAELWGDVPGMPAPAGWERAHPTVRAAQSKRKAAIEAAEAWLAQQGGEAVATAPIDDTPVSDLVPTAAELSLLAEHGFTRSGLNWANNAGWTAFLRHESNGSAVWHVVGPAGYVEQSNLALALERAGLVAPQPDMEDVRNLRAAYVAAGQPFVGFVTADGITRVPPAIMVDLGNVGASVAWSIRQPGVYGMATIKALHAIEDAPTPAADNDEDADRWGYEATGAAARITQALGIDLVPEWNEFADLVIAEIHRRQEQTATISANLDDARQQIAALTEARWEARQDGQMHLTVPGRYVIGRYSRKAERWLGHATTPHGSLIATIDDAMTEDIARACIETATGVKP